MLFDPRPKEARSELFDRDRELELLAKYVSSGSPLILCLGIRRIGKTSVLKVFINESKYPVLYIDARRLMEVGYSKQGFYRLLSEEFTKLKGRFTVIIDYLKSVKGVVIAGHGVEFNWRSRELSISSILAKINEYAEDSGTLFIVAVDEAQYLRFLRGRNKIDFRQIIAYSYDNLRRIKFILTGSEVGLLHRFLGFTDSSSPLYGRVRDEVVIDRFPRDESIKFLEQGFKEAGINTPRAVIEDVVDIVDGIPGWLAYFGYKFTQTSRHDILDKVFKEAVSIALDELRNLYNYSPLYIHILKAIAMGFNNWSNIKRAVEAWTGRTIPANTLYRLLTNLIDMSIISKINEKYTFLDPIYREAARKL